MEKEELGKKKEGERKEVKGLGGGREGEKETEWGEI